MLSKPAEEDEEGGEFVCTLGSSETANLGRRAKKQVTGNNQYGFSTECVCISGSVATGVATVSEFSDEIISFISSENTS